MYDEHWKIQAELHFSSSEYQDYYNDWDWYEENSCYYYVEPKRAERIRHRERMIAKGRNIELQRDWWYWGGDPHRYERAEMYGRYYHNHLAVCSCDSCCNPRRSGWSKGKYKLTIHERRADYDEKDQRKNL